MPTTPQIVMRGELPKLCETIRRIDGSNSDLLPIKQRDHVLYFGETGLFMVDEFAAVRTIIGNQICAGIGVGWEEYRPATHEEPPDADVTEGPIFRSWERAVEWVLVEYFKRRIQAYFEVRAEEELAAAEEPSYDHNEMAAILRERWGDAVEVWHTGGGVMNPVIVLERGDHDTMSGYAVRYLMCSMEWCPVEASMGVYDERHKSGEEALAECFAVGDNGPMEPDAIRRRAADLIEEAQLKQQAAEEWDCEISELVPCEVCPQYDEVCDHCGCTKWVAEEVSK